MTEQHDVEPWSRTKKVAVGAAGGLVAVTGVVMMPLPGFPGTPVLLAGLAILGTEFPAVRARTDRLRAAIRDRLPGLPGRK